MDKIIKYSMLAICHALYHLGDIVSRIADNVEFMGRWEWPYDLYSKLMGWSYFIDEKYDFKVWGVDK